MKCITTGGRFFEAGRVVLERFPTSGRFVEPDCVAKERMIACRRIVSACREVEERIKTNRRVFKTAGETEERVLTLGSIFVRIASVRRWVNRTSGRGSENKCADETDSSYGLICRIHMVGSFRCFL